MIEFFFSASSPSNFHIHRILQRLQKIDLLINEIDAKYIYFVYLEKSLSTYERKKLNYLLNKRQNINNFIPKNKLFLVTPRFGTISPWASKATDIMHNCGLNQINRIERGILYYIKEISFTEDQWKKVASELYDKMTESISSSLEEATKIFFHSSPKAMKSIDLLNYGHKVLVDINLQFGLSLSKEEIDYLYKVFIKLNRNPTDVEIYMFAQVNSEHCRHKIFNANWIINDQKKTKSLFEMIKNTFKHTPDYILSAYKDNSAVMQGSEVSHFFTDPKTGLYKFHNGLIHVLMKVETHNHPTAISPWSGAATGSGGEIRDEGATGCGAKPKAGLVGFSVSNLKIPGFEQPWEEDFGKPENIANALDIINQGSLGSAAFNNEFGRPILNGYFRTYEEKVYSHNGKELRGYHKPIMLSGGIGNIHIENIQKKKINVGEKLIVLGGPAMNIGLGGGSSSSKISNQNDAELCFSSVQRDNPEMERRCQEVINSCWQLGKDNPILFIHDVGAGGLANAISELIITSGYGGYFELRRILIDESRMSPLEIWCNESQERYILAISIDQLSLFDKFCRRERAPYSVIGEVIQKRSIILNDDHFNNKPINLPLDILFNNTPKVICDVKAKKVEGKKLNRKSISISDAINRVLHLPTVAEKTFLITISDRTVTGMVSRDQMVGPWQVPVANCAVTTSSFEGYFGEAIAIGERTPVALLDFAASARLAVGEALTNISATKIGNIKKIKLSANWMVASGHPGEDAGLYKAVKAIGEELCPQLGLTIPIGKDSMSMKTFWCERGMKREMIAPLSVIISAFTCVEDVRYTVTPQILTNDNILLFVDLGCGHNALGATALAQVYRQLGDKPADVRSITKLKSFYESIQILIAQQKLLAYHDRSDGGLVTSLAEMAFTGHCGIKIDISSFGKDHLAILFNEELGAVIQIRESDLQFVKKVLAEYDLSDCVHFLGKAVEGDCFIINSNGKEVFNSNRTTLRLWWSETTWQMQRIRGNPKCADQEYSAKIVSNDPGINVNLSFNMNDNISMPYISNHVRPKVAILREQGINSHVEMAAAFYYAGFNAIDVHMSDLTNRSIKLEKFQILVACGGFSYGDVFGAGKGWANSILLNSYLRDEFESFFSRSQTLTLGVCNGCQMISNLRELIEGTELWPYFISNYSNIFESRFSLVEIKKSPSILFEGMEGSRIPIPVAHSEGRVKVKNSAHLSELEKNNLVVMCYIDNFGYITENYPMNPNGSPNGITSVTNKNGCVTIMMPHPERAFRTVTNSWYPDDWGEKSPWMRIFYNARKHLG